MPNYRIWFKAVNNYKPEKQKAIPDYASGMAFLECLWIS